MATFEEDLALREQIPPEALALMSTPIERSMDHNFETVNAAYEAEKRRNDKLEAEITGLRDDAYRWREFVAMVGETLPWKEE